MDEWIGVGDAAFLDKVNARLRALLDDVGILVLARTTSGSSSASATAWCGSRAAL